MAFGHHAFGGVRGSGFPQLKRILEIQTYRRGAFNAGAIYDENGNNDLALIWYKKAAACGDHNAMYNLGLMYAEGQGVPQDYSKSIYWYEKAANLGLPEGMFEIGKMYHQGVGVVANNEAAELWLMKAYKLGNSSAKNYLIQNSG